MAMKILIGNYKGGVGKTTSVINIGAVLSRKSKVLLIDLDPQSSMSELCLPKTKFSDNNESLSLDKIDYMKYGQHF